MITKESLPGGLPSRGLLPATPRFYANTPAKPSLLSLLV